MVIIIVFLIRKFTLIIFSMWNYVLFLMQMFMNKLKNNIIKVYMLYTCSSDCIIQYSVLT
jgi:hypothetical protein